MTLEAHILSSVVDGMQIATVILLSVAGTLAFVHGQDRVGYIALVAACILGWIGR